MPENIRRTRGKKLGTQSAPVIEEKENLRYIQKVVYIYSNEEAVNLSLLDFPQVFLQFTGSAAIF